MKTTTFFYSVLLSVMAFAFVSCNSTEYRPTVGGQEFVIKKIDGKRQWGLVSEPDYQNKRWPKISCQYDSMYIVTLRKEEPSQYVCIAVKDSKKYAFTIYGEALFGGKNIYNIFLKNGEPKNGGSIYGPMYHKAQTDGGFFFFRDDDGNWETFGPYEAFFEGNQGYSYKKNGKWGVKQHKRVDLTPKDIFDNRYEDQYIDIIPAKYDAAIQVYTGGSFWMMKEGKTWKTFSAYGGEPVNVSQSTIKKFINAPILDYKDFRYRKQDWIVQRIGSQEFGLVQYQLNWNFY